MLAVGVNQRRDIQARIKERTVLALYAHLKAADDGFARQLFAQLRLQIVVIVIGPVRVGRHLTHQLFLAPARHLAESRVHIGNAAIQVKGAHAGQHGVFHGAAEISLGHQGLLRTLAAARVAPGGQQQPGGHGRQGAHQPEQPAAHHAQRGSVSLRPQHQGNAHGRYRHLIFIGNGAPVQQLAGGFARRQRCACQDLALAVQHGDGIAGHHLGGCAIAQDAVHREFGQQLAAVAAVVADGDVQLQQRGWIAGRCFFLHIDRLQHFLGLLEGVQGLALVQHFTGYA